jgi:hypothetical protein
MTPFALQLYERYAGGETAAQLAADLGIPLDRITARLRAAERHLRLRGALPQESETAAAAGGGLGRHPPPSCPPGAAGSPQSSR